MTLPTSPYAGHYETAGLDEAWQQGFKAGVLVPVEPDYDKHYALMRQWTGTITRKESRILLNAALGVGGETP